MARNRKADSKIDPQAEFQSLYQSFWSDRWPALFEALQKEASGEASEEDTDENTEKDSVPQPSKESQIARKNLFSTGLQLTAEQLFRPEFPNLAKRSVVPPGPPTRGPESLLDYYIMDPGSVFIAKLLGVQPGHKVLDMCAAPGGKSLVLIEELAGGQADLQQLESEILLNEVSLTRRERLKKVIQQYVPRSIRDSIFVTGKDGGKFAVTHKEQFDRILVDAPCSGEGHLLSDPKTFAEWSPKWTKTLAQRQYALLTGALEALVPGGEMIFSTCSLSKTENEAVVQRLLDKKSGRVELVPVDVAVYGGENFEGMGYFLPDRSGFGPLFVAKFRKV